MSGNARMLEEEMYQKIRDKKLKPSDANRYAMSAFFAATEVKYHTGVFVFRRATLSKEFLSDIPYHTVCHIRYHTSILAFGESEITVSCLSIG